MDIIIIALVFVIHKTKYLIQCLFRTPKPSVTGSEDGEEGNQEGDEDEDSVMTIDGVEGGYN